MSFFVLLLNSTRVNAQLPPVACSGSLPMNFFFAYVWLQYIRTRFTVFEFYFQNLMGSTGSLQQLKSSVLEVFHFCSSFHFKFKQPFNLFC